jgi:RHS repeat-associated protein
VNRPIVFFDYDNLDQVTAVSQYDGDGVSITSTAGVPNKPASSLLRAYVTNAYDDQGREFESKTFSVNPNDGTVSTNSLTTDYWYNRRGQVIKTSAPGGLVTKDIYDGDNRLNVQYTTDGGGDSSWTDAGNVTGDNVLTQTETQYDSDGNPTLVTTRHRFHDETATGALANATTSPKARVSYMSYYYDLADRPIATVDLGTNGASSYTRPTSVPARSDTVLVTSQTYNVAGLPDSSTDPNGIVGTTYYDAMGRVVKTIADYTDGTPTASSNQTTEYTYDGDNNQLTVQVDLPSSAYEITQYFYGVTTGTGSGINSNDVLSKVQYPDPLTGYPSTTISQRDTYTVDALGDPLSHTDPQGNVHSYSYDALGRQTADAVTTLGSGVDGSVRRIETAYNTQGLPYLFTSYDSASGGSVVNQVQDAFNGLGQLVTEYQSHSGAVNTSTTPKVQYTYVEMASGANNSRQTSMTYPNGRVVSYNYASGLDSSISRLSSISDSSGTLESYKYLGLGGIVEMDHPETNVNLTYISPTSSTGDAGDKYVGLDRFGRVVDQNWFNTSTSSSTDDFQYGYDRDSNLLYLSNTVSSSNSELYGYNGLNELTSFKRGTLNSGKTDMTGTPTVNKTWGLDAVGNWLSNGTELRSANKLNQITSISSLATPAYDNNGNTIIDQNSNTLIYDAWNRLVKVKFGTTVLETDSYDGLSRKVVENTGTARDIYFSQNWQDIEEDVSGAAKLQYVWGNGYIDHLVERDRDADGNSSNGLEEKLFAQQNANWDVTSLVNTSGAVQERYQYDPYGTVTILTGAWGSRSTSSFSWAVLHQDGRFDTATGLYDFRNREYNPVLGRWMQNDPLGFGGGDVNTYRALADEPLNRIDPSGLWNYWNPLTWGTGNPSTDHWYNKINPFGESAHWGATGLGLAQGANDIFVQPVKRTGQFAYDVVPTAVDPYYQPYNPYLRQYINKESGYLSTWGNVTSDAVTTALLAEGGVRGVRGFFPRGSSCPAPKSLPIRTPGGKTSGLLRTPNGTTTEQMFTSGVDGSAASMPKGSPGFDIVTRTHAEGHAAAWMSQNGVMDATLHINNYEICPSCFRLLPRMLGFGRTLTVIGPNGTSVTFVGVAP